MKFKPSNVIQTEKKMKKRRWLCCNFFIPLSCGLLLISLTVGLLMSFEVLYEAIIANALRLNEESHAFRKWRTNDPPLPMDIYVFNWTNPEDIRNHSIKPRFEEVGPYKFLEVKEKVGIQWNNNETITFRHRKSYFYDEEHSVRNMSEDVINTINVVPLTIGYKVKDFGYMSKKLVSYTLSTMSSLYVTKTSREILFDGYEESILHALSYVPMTNVKERFGIFYGKNGTFGSDGVFTMSTVNDNTFGKLISWNYKNKTNFYEDECNEIKGSAGEFYPINRKRDRLVLYSAELCKYAELEYEKDVIIKGVLGYKFTGRNIFDNGTTRPENRCFCKGECLPSGVFNVSACRDDSPTFLSMPHFFGADPYYYTIIDGIKPDVNKHEFYITVEPKSGIVMECAARMQLNMMLQPVSEIRLYKDVPRIFVPLFYFDQKIELQDDLAASLRLIQNLPEYGKYLEIVFVSLGAILVIWSLCSLFCCRSNDEKPFYCRNKYPKTYDNPNNTRAGEDIRLYDHPQT